MRRALLGALAVSLLAVLLHFRGIPPKVSAAKPRALIDTYVYGSTSYAPGSQAALRILTFASRSETVSEPIPGAEVAILLRAKSGTASRLFSGKSNDQGSLDANFRIPAVASGKYVLEVQTSSALGKDVQSQEVEVLPSARILLITDKPLYQPGQLIQMRALALRNIDQRPLGKEPLSFEVEDSKGNKVFRRHLTTDEYGIAAARFQLADEINLGAYHLRASFDNAQLATPAEKVVTIKRYVLPKFKVEVSTERKFFLPGQELSGRVSAGYFFGKPVDKGQVTVAASTFDVGFHEFAKLHGWTDAGGGYSFKLKLPDHFVGQPLEKGKALVKLEVRVKDKAQHSEQVTRTYPVAGSGIQLELYPEAGRIVPDLENVLYAAVTYPDGRPAAKAAVTLELESGEGSGAKGGKTLQQSADEVGLARFRFTPQRSAVKATSYWTRKLDAQAELGKVVQLEGEGAAAIETALRGRLSSMQTCYRYQVQRDPTLSGELVAELTVENRRVTNVQNIRNTAATCAGSTAACRTGPGYR